MCVTELFMLSIRLLVNIRLLVVKFMGSQKLYADNCVCVWVSALNPCIVQGPTVWRSDILSWGGKESNTWKQRTDRRNPEARDEDGGPMRMIIPSALRTQCSNCTSLMKHVLRTNRTAFISYFLQDSTCSGPVGILALQWFCVYAVESRVKMIRCGEPRRNVVRKQIRKDTEDINKTVMNPVSSWNWNK